MNNNPEIHHRRSIRIKNYDYSQSGAYFITICTQNREFLFGEITDGEMVFHEYGVIACNEWNKLPTRFPNIELDFFQIMPNHIHGIIIVGATLAVAQNVGATLAVAQHTRAGASPAPTTTTTTTIGDIVGAYKSLVSNECLKIFKSKGEYMGKFWQRNYYEHIIRDDDQLNQIREYIQNNPLNWNSDRENL